MKLGRRTFLHLAAGDAALPALSRIAWAQTYPAKAMTPAEFGIFVAEDSATWSKIIRAANITVG